MASGSQRSLDWDDGVIVAVDQCALPWEYRLLRLSTVDELIGAIQRLAIRGAPALGVAGALGVALAAHNGVPDVRADAARIADARPTAVNLRWGVARAVAALTDGPAAVLAEALAMLDEDERTNRAAAGRAAELVRRLCPGRPLRLLTHCNTGGLATVAWGTALGTVRDLARSRAVAEVFVDESRPLLQGARLTVWELARSGIPHRLCVDSAGPAAIATGQVDCVLVGADRIAANGDVANKIGTYGLACAAARSGVPFIVVAPESTIDAATADGSGIRIEERGADEVLAFGGHPVTLPGTRVFNPAFDVTPNELITAVVTEREIRWGGAARRSAPEVGAVIADRIRVVTDFPTPGIAFQDLAEVYADGGLLREAAGAIARRPWGPIDRIVGLEARGFPVATAVALATGGPLVLVRKPGKLPGAVRSVSYGLEYGTDRLELQTDAVRPGERVLLVDDVLATGGTLAAAAQLVAAAGGTVAGCAVLVELSALDGRRQLDPLTVFAVHRVTVAARYPALADAVGADPTQSGEVR